MSAPVPWTELRRFTSARVALGRAGNGLPTAAHLDFQEAHARARDAVHSGFDAGALDAALAPLGLLVVRVASQAPDRRSYLLRPDLGRRLREADRDRLPAAPGAFLFVVADGLCATGVQRHAPALIAAALPLLRRAGMAIAPIVLADQARVALGDEIGGAMGAAMVVMLIGERPGLTALDSLGAYLTWKPRPGRTDAERNCISNIRPGGLSPVQAAEKLAWLAGAALRLGETGVALKDEQPAVPLLPAMLIRVTPRISIEDSELQEDFLRASGAGGQNIQKVETAVQLRFDVAHSPNLPEPVRQRLLRLGGRRITQDGVLVITAQRHRTQARNREDAMERLLDLIREAAAPPPPPRRPTKPTLGSKTRRLEGKSKRGDVKRMRGRPEPD